MTYKDILSYLIISVFTFTIFYISGLYGAMNFILSLCIYAIVFYLFHFIWVKIRKKNIMYFPYFINYFLKRVSVFLLFITVTFYGLSYLSNEIYPASMPEYTLSNGEKTITFQAMAHIGTPEFYEKIANNISKHKEEGGVYFFEGVRPGTEENVKKFNKAMGIEFDKDLYKNFSKLYGVSYQDNEKFLGLVNNLDFNIDLNLDQIIELYEEKLEANTGVINKSSLMPIDANKTILDTLAQLNEKELKILVYINQAILNFIIQNESTKVFLTDNFTNKLLFEVILDKRNEVISKEILNSKYNNIYITYGELHFKGVFEILQQNDPNWKIVEVRNYYPIR